MRFDKSRGYLNRDETRQFLQSVAGKDVWFQALTDWMYYFKILSIDMNSGDLEVAYYDLDNPDQNRVEGYDTMEISMDDGIDIFTPIELLTTAELNEWRRVVEDEEDKDRYRQNLFVWGPDPGEDNDEFEDDD